MSKVENTDIRSEYIELIRRLRPPIDERFAMSTVVPAAACKSVRMHGTELTMVEPAWRISQMTRAHGLAGSGSQRTDGWSTTIKDTRVEVFDLGENSTCTVVTVLVQLWVHTELGERTIATEQYGSTRVTRANCDEVFKSSVTDAIGKCLSFMGVGLSVYFPDKMRPSFIEQMTADLNAAADKEE